MVTQARDKILVFLRPLSEIRFEDIQSLQRNQIHESDVLDYKGGLLDDDSLVRHITAFANTKGGFLVFGVEETGKGGWPKSIPGVESAETNKERIEQILLSNISPRVHVKIKQIEHTDPGKCVLVAQIPDSYLKPHMNLRTKKFHKRYQFEAHDMEEREISDAYRTRFAEYARVNEYIESVLNRAEIKSGALGQIIVIPAILDLRLLDTSDEEAIRWIDPSKIDPKPSGSGSFPSFDYIPGLPRPGANGIVCQTPPLELPPRLEIHRNGCVEYITEAGSPSSNDQKRVSFRYVRFCARLLHTLQFASMVCSRYNYFGDVRIVASVRSRGNLVIPLSAVRSNEAVSEVERIRVEREVPSGFLESNFSSVSSGIMDEIFNHFGLWRCELFDENHNYIPAKF